MSNTITSTSVAIFDDLTGTYASSSGDITFWTGTNVISHQEGLYTKEGKYLTDPKEMYEYAAKLYWNTQLKELLDETTPAP